MLALVLAAALAAAAGAPLDTVFLANGGRALGTVFEDDPAAGVAIQLPDGSIRRFARGEVLRVEYAGAAAAAGPAGPAFPAVPAMPPTPPPAEGPPPPPQAVPAEPEPPPPQAYSPDAPTAPPPQAYAPQPPPFQPPAAAPPPPPAPPPPGSPLALTFSLGTGGAYTAGPVGGNLGHTSDWWPGFMLFQLEAGFRPSPSLTLLLYLDGGGGDAARDVRAACATNGLDCGAGSARIGVMARHAFTPTAPRTAWLGVGTGFESTGLMIDGPSGEERISFDGWEALRLAAGVDFRSSTTFGVGFFAGVSFATYGKAKVEGPAYIPASDLGTQRLHTWFQLGGRLILFP
jgi:hypothetical protein